MQNPALTQWPSTNNTRQQPNSTPQESKALSTKIAKLSTVKTPKTNTAIRNNQKHRQQKLKSTVKQSTHLPKKVSIYRVANVHMHYKDSYSVGQYLAIDESHQQSISRKVVYGTLMHIEELEHGQLALALTKSYRHALVLSSDLILVGTVTNNKVVMKLGATKEFKDIKNSIIEYIN